MSKENISANRGLCKHGWLKIDSSLTERLSPIYNGKSVETKHFKWYSSKLNKYPNKYLNMTTKTLETKIFRDKWKSENCVQKHKRIRLWREWRKIELYYNLIDYEWVPWMVNSYMCYTLNTTNDFTITFQLESWMVNFGGKIK